MYHFLYLNWLIFCFFIIIMITKLLLLKIKGSSVPHVYILKKMDSFCKKKTDLMYTVKDFCIASMQSKTIWQKVNFRVLLVTNGSFAGSNIIWKIFFIHYFVFSQCSIVQFLSVLRSPWEKGFLSQDWNGQTEVMEDA